ncbi:MAG TPA: ATP-binding protein [Rhizomicrobium sp.]
MNRADKSLKDPAQARRDEAERKLQAAKRFGEILMPEDADEPILHPIVRAMLHEWLVEINNAPLLKADGLKPRSLCLLWGPPGCGKTTFAHHFAARLGLPLLNIKTETMVESRLGGTPRLFGELFDALEPLNGKVLVFLDEIDSIGSKRTSSDACAQELAAALNVMLRRIEKFNGVAMAATNRHDELDPALWRRFSLQIEIMLPSEEERFAILRRYSSPYDLADDDVELLVELTRGASPALLRQLMEGMKRTLILDRKLKRETDNAGDVFARLIHSVSPPPGYGELPPMWADPGAALEQIAKISWPPQRSTS